MSSLVDTATIANALNGSSTDEIPINIQREAERLASRLGSAFTGALPGCVLMLEVGTGKRSYLWLAKLVAAYLREKHGRSLNVLSVAPESARRSAKESSGIRLDSSGSSCLERISVDSSPDLLTQRLVDLRNANFSAIVHMAQQSSPSLALSDTRTIDGVVILVRSGSTRRTVLQVTLDQLTGAGLSVLGCVLLDRIHPVPERLYQLL